MDLRDYDRPRTGPHVMLFDLYTEGHHPHHIIQLAAYWASNGLGGRLDIVVPPELPKAHPVLMDLASGSSSSGIRVVPMPEAAAVNATHFSGIARLDLLHGRLLKKYVETLRPDHCLLMYFDHVQLSLAFGLRFDIPVQLAGIYFRPSFHYGYLGQPSAGLKESLVRLRKRLLLSLALRNPHFTHLFCADPYVVPHIPDMAARGEAVALPDGVVFGQDAASPGDVRTRWGVEDGRKVAVLFGSLSSRKGLFTLLDAIRLLPEHAQGRLCLILAGRIVARERDKAHRQVHDLKAVSRVQILLDDSYIQDEEIQPLIRASDLVLVPYQKHIGSSGVLVRAAAEQVPVLGSDFGVVGEHIRRYGLGVALDTTSAPAVATWLDSFLSREEPIRFDAEGARRFAGQNTAEQMVETILGKFGALNSVSHATAH